MGYVFPTLVGTFLLLPILFVLNRWLQLSLVGMLTVSLFSFLLIMLLLLSQAVFPVWQGAVLIVVLAVCAAYLLQKRWETALFEEREEKEGFMIQTEQTETIVYAEEPPAAEQPPAVEIETEYVEEWLQRGSKEGTV